MSRDTEDFLFKVLAELASTAASTAAYENWSDEFSRQEIREVWWDTPAPLRRLLGRTITISELREINKQILLNLGFRYWDTSLICIPLWVYNYIRDGEVLISINGETKTKGQDEIDLDIRRGCIAFGFKPDLN